MFEEGELDVMGVEGGGVVEFATTFGVDVFGCVFVLAEGEDAILGAKVGVGGDGGGGGDGGVDLEVLIEFGERVLDEVGEVAVGGGDEVFDEGESGVVLGGVLVGLGEGFEELGLPWGIVRDVDVVDEAILAGVLDGDGEGGGAIGAENLVSIDIAADDEVDVIE